jgi:GNAT superfamily N-acetyltransferase
MLWTDKDANGAICAFRFPDEKAESIWFYIRNGTWPLLRQHRNMLPRVVSEGARSLRRFQRYAKPMERQQKAIHAQYGEFIYVFLVGVRPECQGMGLGRRLTECVLDRARAEGKAVYLEATSDSSRRFYARLGFKQVGLVEADGDRDAPPLFAMIWEPEGDSHTTTSSPTVEISAVQKQQHQEEVAEDHVGSA